MESTKLGYFSKDLIWNSVIIKDDYSMCRERVEALIIKGNRVFLVFKNNGQYRIPGGSSEPDKLLEVQLFNECREEARIVITNPVYQFTYDEMVKKTKYGVKYDGRVNHLFIAKYCKKYKGYIAEEDIDISMAEFGKFYKINKIFHKLKDEHKRALLPYTKKSIQKKYSYLK